MWHVKVSLSKQNVSPTLYAWQNKKLILPNRTTTSVTSNKKFAMQMQQNIETQNHDEQLYVLI